MGGENNMHPTSPSLYERLGGDPFINMFYVSFYDEMAENDQLSPFFQNTSLPTLRIHQVKLFRLVFGSEQKTLKQDDLLEYIFRIHARMFLELGANEAHFDQFVKCFEGGLQTLQTEQALIDECVAALLPLRAVFQYGAQVARKERRMSPEEIQDLPVASVKTIGTDTQVVLPEYQSLVVPASLRNYIQKNSKTACVRAWTADLSTRFGVEGDPAIADTFLDQPYMDHQVYLIAFMELAFLSDEDLEPGRLHKALQIVRFPRGKHHSPLSRTLFDKMITQFLLTCHIMGMTTSSVKVVETKLRSYRDHFSLKTVIVGGVNAPHVLQTKKKKKKKKSTRTIRRMNSNTTASSAASADISACMHRLGFDDDDDDSDGEYSATSGFSAFSDLSGASGGSAAAKKATAPRQKKTWSFFKTFAKKKTKVTGAAA